MDLQEIREKVKHYILENEYVSYAELEQFFEQIGYDYHGSFSSVSSVCDYVVFWSGWSKEAIDLVNDLYDEGIHKQPTPILTYILDGATLNLPLVKRDMQYKKSHWLPVVFHSISNQRGVRQKTYRW